MGGRRDKMWVHLPMEIRAEIERAAAEQGRSLSNVIFVVMRDWAAQREADRAKAA